MIDGFIGVTVINTWCVCMCLDAVAGSQHLAFPQYLPAVCHRAGVPLPLQDAGGEES